MLTSLHRDIYTIGMYDTGYILVLKVALVRDFAWYCLYLVNSTLLSLSYVRPGSQHIQCSEKEYLKQKIAERRKIVYNTRKGGIKLHATCSPGRERKIENAQVREENQHHNLLMEGKKPGYSHIVRRDERELTTHTFILMGREMNPWNNQKEREMPVTTQPLKNGRALLYNTL